MGFVLKYSSKEKNQRDGRIDESKMAVKPGHGSMGMDSTIMSPLCMKISIININK